jgi:pimeloyl-ACP methyl ester carboxylesterase
VERVRIDGAELEVEAHGDGEPVLLLHGSSFSSIFRPMLPEDALAGWRLILYNRRGFEGSSPVPPGFRVEDQAADVVALLARLGVERAHVVGHSYGGAIAMQLAVDAPRLVQTLSLLEPPLPSAPGAAEFERTAAPLVERWKAGAGRAAYDDLLVAVGGLHYRMALDHFLPGAYEQGFRDLATYFEVELPSVARWRFSAREAAAISAPTLLMVGSKTGSWFKQGHAILREWLPRADAATIEGATHLLEVTHPRPVAKTLAAFFLRHPLDG